MYKIQNRGYTIRIFIALLRAQDVSRKYIYLTNSSGPIKILYAHLHCKITQFGLRILADLNSHANNGISK